MSNSVPTCIQLSNSALNDLLFSNIYVIKNGVNMLMNTWIAQIIGAVYSKNVFFEIFVRHCLQFLE